MEKKSSSKITMTSERGMSLVDALIGVMLIGLIGTFLMGSFRTFMMGARTSSDRAQALNIAQQALEEFKKNDGATIADQEWIFTVDAKDKKYLIASERNSPVAGLENRLVSCQVTVQWETPQGDESLSLVGYYYLVDESEI